MSLESIYVKNNKENEWDQNANTVEGPIESDERRIKGGVQIL